MLIQDESVNYKLASERRGPLRRRGFDVSVNVYNYLCCNVYFQDGYVENLARQKDEDGGRLKVKAADKGYVRAWICCDEDGWFQQGEG